MIRRMNHETYLPRPRIRPYNVAMLTIGQTCVHHPDRKGIALCMGCRAVLCPECATLRDGIHYCARCLAAERSSKATSRPVSALVLVMGAATALFLAGFGLRALLLELAS